MDYDILDKLIEQQNITFSSVYESGIPESEAYSYLFVCDLIKASELSGFFQKAKRTIYKKYFSKQLREKFSKCVIAPVAVFKNIDEYILFLKWRDENRGIHNIKDTVVAEELGYSVRHIRRLKRRNLLIAGTKPGTILKESVNVLKKLPKGTILGHADKLPCSC